MTSTELIDQLRPDVEKTITALRNRKFDPDPIAGPHFSRVVSLMSSAYKRHGFILERAILERVKMKPGVDAWEDRDFQVTNTADHIVDTIIAEPTSALGSSSAYGPGHRALQIDLIAYDQTKKEICCYEIKRGSGLHDSGKRRSMLRDLLCAQVLLKSYAEGKGLDVVSARSYIIFGAVPDNAD